MIYEYELEHNGRTIGVKAATNTGTQVTESGTVQMHTLSFLLDGAFQFPVTATDQTLPQASADGIDALKDQIDNVSGTEKILLDLGFTPDTQVDAVMGFAATQPNGAGTISKLNWQVMPGIIYNLEQARQADFNDAQYVERGDSGPFELGVLPPGMYYFRVKGKAEGLMDSPWSTASLNVL